NDCSSADCCAPHRVHSHLRPSSLGGPRLPVQGCDQSMKRIRRRSDGLRIIAASPSEYHRTESWLAELCRQHKQLSRWSDASNSRLILSGLANGLRKSGCCL